MYFQFSNVNVRKVKIHVVLSMKFLYCTLIQEQQDSLHGSELASSMAASDVASKSNKNEDEEMKPGKCKETKELKIIMTTHENNSILNFFASKSGRCRFHSQLAYNTRMILSVTEKPRCKVATEKLICCSVGVFL